MLRIFFFIFTIREILFLDCASAWIELAVTKVDHPTLHSFWSHLANLKLNDDDLNNKPFCVGFDNNYFPFDWIHATVHCLFFFFFLCHPRHQTNILSGKTNGKKSHTKNISIFWPIDRALKSAKISGENT